MRTIAAAAVAVFVICHAPSVAAQTGSPVAGTWQVAGLGQRPWLAVLNVAGSELTGTVGACGWNPGAILPAQVSNGRVTGNTITFTCANLDRSETITFAGTVNGDELTLDFERRSRDGSPLPERPAEATGLFRTPDLRRVVATRVRTGGKELGGAVNLVSKGVKVEGALFLPRNVERVRSVFVLANSGTSWTGLAASVYTDTDVRALAGTLDAGLLLLRVTPLDIDGYMFFVTNAAAGGDEGLILLLDRLAADSGHPELRRVPLVFWGHSAAGPFGTTFALRHPERTIAFVRYHSGVGGMPRDLTVLQHIPALFLQAEGDIAGNRASFDDLQAEWQRGRLAGAPWTVGIEPGAVHQSPADVKKANALLLPWLRAVLGARVPTAGGALRPAPSGQSIESNWFPDEASARAWRTVAVLSP